MLLLKKRPFYFSFLLTIFFCLGLPRPGLSERADAGFYAGPLSAIAETVIDTAETNLEPSPSPSAGDLEAPRE